MSVLISKSPSPLLGGPDASSCFALVHIILHRKKKSDEEEEYGEEDYDDYDEDEYSEYDEE